MKYIILRSLPNDRDSRVKRKKILTKFLPLYILFSSVFLFLINIFRSDYLEISAATRLQILYDTIMNTGFISESFGKFTNSYTLISKEMYIMDSFYASLLGNLGYLGFIFLLLVIVYLFIFSWLKANVELVAFWVIIILFSFSTIITEVYLMNLLLPIAFAHLYLNKCNFKEDLKNDQNCF